MRFDAFEIDGKKIVFSSKTGQTLLFDMNEDVSPKDFKNLDRRGKTR